MATFFINKKARIIQESWVESVLDGDKIIDVERVATYTFKMIQDNFYSVTNWLKDLKGEEIIFIT